MLAMLYIFLTLVLQVSMDRDQKIRTLHPSWCKSSTLLSCMTSIALSARDTKWISLRQAMVDSILKFFLELSADKVKEFIDSCIGNVMKAYEDLRENKPTGIDLSKATSFGGRWGRGGGEEGEGEEHTR